MRGQDPRSEEILHSAQSPPDSYAGTCVGKSDFPLKKVIYRLSFMENDFWRDGPDDSTTRSAAAQARGVLHDLNVDGAELSKRVVTPWWYHSALALIVAVFIGSLAVPGALSTMVVVLGVIALPLLTTAYSRRYGITITQPAGPRSKRLLLATLGIALAALLAGVAIKLVAVSPWWTYLPAAVAFVATLVLGRGYDSALRSEIADDQNDGHKTP